MSEFDRTAEAVGEEEKSVDRRKMEAREEEHIPMDECNAFRGISQSIFATALSLGLSFPGPLLLQAEEAEPFRTCAFLASRAKFRPSTSSTSSSMVAGELRDTLSCSCLDDALRL